MSGSTARITKAFAFEKPDRTPLFEIFQPYHPIHWDICGRTIGADMAMAWDAMSDGVAWSELVNEQIKAGFMVANFFGLDMVRLNGAPPRDYPKPRKLGRHRWLLQGVNYHLNERTKLVELEDPAAEWGDSRRVSEDDVRKQIESWDGKAPAPGNEIDPVLKGVQELAKQEDLDWIYMGEIGAGTGVAFYPPFMLMWMLEEPELFQRWLDMQKANSFPATLRMIEQGCKVIALGGDVSCDKGPFISPALYRRFILPVIQEHTRLIHDAGAKAVYTSDGNHWAIKEPIFFESGIDGYKEVDKAAGMTWPRLIEEGVAGRVCIIGNIDARHILCNAGAAEVRAEVLECLRYGQHFNGGHILHASHSVHEDVKIENYYAVVETYREFFGLGKLSR